MTEVWTRWEGQVIQGVYPLRRFLSASDHSAVFLTASNAEGVVNAAIKIVPADSKNADAQLARWRAALALSHPHLIRLLDTGRFELGGVGFVFVVMEYAEETLAQILPYRALDPDEIQDLLLPTLDALEFLHAQGLVHGQLKPSNFLVVDDHLKLASDTVRSKGERVDAAMNSAYASPEQRSGTLVPAADVWGLGLTMVEALTQYPPSWPHARADLPSLPPGLPPVLIESIRRCLSRDPARRPSIAELRTRMIGLPAPPGAAGAAAGASRTHRAASSTPAPPAEVRRPVAAASPAVTGASSGPTLERPRAAVPDDLMALRADRDRARSTGTAGLEASASAPYREDSAGSGRVVITVIALAALGAAGWFGYRMVEDGRRGSTAPSATGGDNHGAATDSQNSSSGSSIASSSASADGAPSAGASASGPSEPAAGSQSSASSVSASPKSSPSMETSPSTADSSGAPATESSGVDAATARQSGAVTPAQGSSADRPSSSGTVAASSGNSGTQDGIVHQELPRVPRSALDTIHGTIKVVVDVTVDGSGSVTNESLKVPGPSAYFARLSTAAASKWAFAPGSSPDAQQRRIQFEYSQDGPAAHLVPGP